MYVRVEHLQFLHYFYFAAAIFNFSSMIITAGTSFSQYFLAFCAIHMGFSWYIALVVRKSMEYYADFSSLWFFGKHLVLALIAAGFAILMWLSTPFESTLIVWYSTHHGIELFNAIAYSNYIVLFMTVMWYALSRTRFLSGILRVYDMGLFRKAKEAFVRARRDRKIQGLANRKDVEEYMYGSDPKTDRRMISLSRGGSREEAIDNIRMIDIQICRKSIESMREGLERLRQKGAPPGDIEALEKSIREKEESLEKYIREPMSISMK